MKKLMVLLLTLSLALTSGFGSLSFACSKYINYNINEEGEKLLSKYLYTDLEGFQTNISLIAKNGLVVKKENIPKNIEKYMKELDFLQSEIEYEISTIREDFEIYKDDSEISDGLLVINLIASSYKLAIEALKAYVQAKDVDEEYSSLQSYFKVMDNARRDANSLKEYISNKN